jgi:hypothetical protein
VFIATLAATSYYFLCWAQEDHPKYLVWAAASTFLATLARYDGWFLFLMALLMISLIGWLKHQRWAQIEGNLLVFGTLGGLGIALWILWCAIIFGDPLYFQRGPYSAQAQQQGFIQLGSLYTYHDLWQSLLTYLLASFETIGPLLFVLSIIALLVFVLKNRFPPNLLAASLFVAPIPFYIISLYFGQAILSVPDIAGQLIFSLPGVPGQLVLSVPAVLPTGTPQTLFNARYGAQAVAPAALLLAILASPRRPVWAVLRSLRHIVLVIAILAQTILIASGGVISLQNAQQNGCSRPFATLLYLSQHYNGGRVLEDFYTSKFNELAEVGIDFKNVIYEGSGDLWQKSLAHPATMVDWIILNPDDPSDLVAQTLKVDSPTFRAQFTRVAQESDGLSLFQRQGLPELPAKPIPSDLLAGIQSCAGTAQKAPAFIAASNALTDQDSAQG